MLCYTSADCGAVADALRARGVLARIQALGWLEAPATRAVRLALALAAFPDDLYAAIGWLTLGPARLPLEDALRNAVDGVLASRRAPRRSPAQPGAGRPRPCCRQTARPCRRLSAATGRLCRPDCGPVAG